ncbi:MAG: hypothetical protein ABIN97_01715 [Ginsengibacter sp.]
MLSAQLYQLFLDYAANFNSAVIALLDLKNNEYASERKKLMAVFKKEQKEVEKILSKIRVLRELK